MAGTSSSITNIISQGLQNFQPGGVYPIGQGAAQSVQQALAMQAQNRMMQAQQTEPIMPEDPEHWGSDEQLKMFVWFMKMHHEEDIKGFKAMRDIERSVEREEQLERERQRWELEQKYYASQAAQQSTQIQAANARLRKIVDELQVSDKPKKKWWKL